MNSYYISRDTRDLKDHFHITVIIAWEGDERTIKHNMIYLLHRLFPSEQISNDSHRQTFRVFMDANQLSYVLNYIKYMKYPYKIFKSYYFNITRDTYNSTSQYFKEEFGLDISYMHSRSRFQCIEEDSFYVGIKFKGPSMFNEFEEVFGSHCDGIKKYQTISVFNEEEIVYYAKNITKKFMIKFNLLRETLGAKLVDMKIGGDVYRRFGD